MKIQVHCLSKVIWELPTISLSYSYIAPTVIDAISDRGCESRSVVNGTTLLTGCYAGRSIIMMSGRYIWPDTQVWIGNEPVSNWDFYVSSFSLSFTVPNVDTTPGRYYNIRIVNAVTNFVFKNAINFVSTPQISNITECVDKATPVAVGYWRAYCLEGDTFTFNTVNMRGRSTPQVWIGPYECPNARVLDDHTVQCTVPHNPDNTTDVEALDFYLSWPDHNTTAVSIMLWDHIYAPRIDKLTSPSCYQSADPNIPLQCLDDPVNGLNLTIHASRMPAVLPSPTKRWKGLFYSGYVRAQLTGNCEIMSNSTFLCVFMERYSVPTDTLLHFTVVPPSAFFDDGSNVLPLVVVKQITYDTDDFESHTLAIVVCIVLLLVLALILVGCVYWYRKKKMTAESESDVTIRFDDSMNSRLMPADYS